VRWPPVERALYSAFESVPTVPRHKIILCLVLPHRKQCSPTSHVTPDGRAGRRDHVSVRIRIRALSHKSENAIMHNRALALSKFCDTAIV